ncbi:hypothetical protein L1887_53045 [Cichorium endivia]|nr:hypothetical protein L1887_53045 [Cichorium endivia]
MRDARYVYGTSMRDGTFDAGLGKAAKIDALVKIDAQTLIRRGKALWSQGRLGPCDSVDTRTVEEILAAQRDGSGAPDDAIRIFEMPRGWYAQETTFVPRRSGAGPHEEDDGWLVCYVFDEAAGLHPSTGEVLPGATSELWIIDAREMKTVVARVKLPPARTLRLTRHALHRRADRPAEPHRPGQDQVVGAIGHPCRPLLGVAARLDTLHGTRQSSVVQVLIRKARVRRILGRSTPRWRLVDQAQDRAAHRLSLRARLTGGQEKEDALVDVSNALEELGSHGALGTGDGADEAASALPVLTHHQTAVAKSVGLAVDAVLEEAVVGKGAEGLVAVPAEREASGEGFAGSGGSTLAEALNGQSACAALEGLAGHKGVLGLDAAERTLLAVVLVALTTPLRACTLGRSSGRSWGAEQTP